MANFAQLGLAMSGVGKGIAQGRQDRRTDDRADEQRKEQRSQFWAEQDIRKAQLAKLGGTPTGPDSELATQIALQKQQNELETLKGSARDMEQQKLFKMLDRFDGVKDPDILTKFYSKNKTASEAIGNPSGFSKVDVANETDKAQLALLQKKYEDPDGNPETDDGIDLTDQATVNNRFVKIYRGGKPEIVDLMDLYAKSGYLNQYTTQEQKKILANLDIRKKKKDLDAPAGTGTPSADIQLIQAAGAAQKRINAGTGTAADTKTIEAFESKYVDKGKTGSITRSQLKLQDRDKLTGYQERRAKGDADFTPAEKAEYVSLLSSDQGSKAAGQLKASFSREYLDKRSYLTTEQNQQLPEATKSALDQIQAYSDLNGEQKKKLRDTAGLITLGSEAAKISDATTGIIDSAWQSIRKKVSESGEGYDETFAMEQYNQVLMHKMFGSALTEQEIKRFEKAYGTNSNQMASILSSLKSSMSTIHGELSVIKNEHPYLTKKIAGDSLDKLNDTIFEVIQRQKYVELRDAGKSHAQAYKAAQAMSRPAKYADLKPAKSSKESMRDKIRADLARGKK